MKKMKSLWRRAVAMVFVLASILAMSAPALAAGYVLPNGSYVLYSTSKHTGLNVQYKAGDKGRVVVDEINGETNEIWILENVGYGPYVTLRPYHSSRCYLSGEKGFDGDLIIRSGFPSEKKFQWQPISKGNGQYIFKNRQTGYVIDCAYGHNEEIGNRYLTYESNGFVEAQHIYPVRISELTTALTPSSRVTNLKEAWYTMHLNGNYNQVVNIQYAAGEGGKAVVDPDNTQTNEVVRIVPRGNGLYSIHFAHNMNLCLAPEDIFPDSSMRLRKFNSNDPDCLWEIYRSGNGHAFRNAGTLLMLDDYCYRTATGTPIIAYSFTGTGQGPQIFRLEEEKNFSIGPVSPVPAGVFFNTATVDNGVFYDGNGDGRADAVHHDINRMRDSRGVETGITHKNVPVYAMVTGKATYKQVYSWSGNKKLLTSYGNCIELKTDDGEWRIIYAHLDRFEDKSLPLIISNSNDTWKKSGGTTKVLDTRKVNQGQVLGYIGTTGNSGGNHLHIEVYHYGKRVDPTTVVKGLTR